MIRPALITLFVAGAVTSTMGSAVERAFVVLVVAGVVALALWWVVDQVVAEVKFNREAARPLRPDELELDEVRSSPREDLTPGRGTPDDEPDLRAAA